MSATPWVPAVRKIKDGETVEQSTVNPPLDQLIQRDQHLYEKFNELLGKSVLLAFDQPVHPDATFGVGLSVAYYKEDVNGTGLDKAITGFSSSNARSMYAPTDSNFTFGIVRGLNASGTKADLYIHGLCELSYNLDDAVYGLIEQDASSPETFEVGPYYLSRRYPGKITKNPAGIPVYVGYALSKTSFLLQPSVDEFSQFFINYRYNVLDRPAGTPLLTTGTWTLPDTTAASAVGKLGWVTASATVLPGVAIPAGAKFFYYIPGGDYQYDDNLTDNEKIEASELKAALPPIPSNFVQITVNGITQRLMDDYTPDGIYSVDQYGLWWYSDEDGKQPWASDLASGVWETTDWPTTKGSDELRPRTFISFSKFNPALRTQLVSSLRPFYGGTSLIRFYSKDNPTEEAFTGDLYAKIVPEFTVTEANTGTAVSSLTFDDNTGKFLKGVTPVVSQLTGAGDIKVTEVGSGEGKYQVSYKDEGLTGFVDSIEPVNASLEFMGLNSYIKLPYFATISTPYALIGKIILPSSYAITSNLKLTLHLFGSRSYGTETTRNVALTFQYAVSKLGVAITSAASSPVTASFPLTATPTSYTLNTIVKVSSPTLVVPQAALTADAIVNFKLTRALLGSGDYTGDIGLLGIYWSI